MSKIVSRFSSIATSHIDIGGTFYFYCIIFAYHAEYGEHEAIYEIDILDIMRGSLPRRAHALVLEWATLHRNELRDDWARARMEKPLMEIEGLE